MPPLVVYSAIDLPTVLYNIALIKLGTVTLCGVFHRTVLFLNTDMMLVRDVPVPLCPILH